MAANIKLKRSAVQSRVPTTSDLELGELGLNTYDGKVYMKKDDGTAAIVEVGGGGAVFEDDSSDDSVYPVTATRDVKIGGTLPSSPNIELNNDGSIVTTADATISGMTVGLGSGSIIYNTVVGREAFESNTTGGSNTAIGQETLYSNTTGRFNTAVGRACLYENTTGIFNTALGLYTLQNNTEGANNAAMGPFALQSNTTGDYNIALGRAALSRNTTGDSNTALGFGAGAFIEGSNNTILGAYAGTSADSTLNDTVIISAGTTERLRIDSSGDVLIGGTLPSAPNIELNADGSAEFAGKLVSASTVSGDAGTTLATKDYVDSSGGGGAFEDDSSDDSVYPATSTRDVKIGGTLPSAPNIELNADGSSTFALDAAIHGVTVGRGNSSINTNTAVGNGALLTNTTGNNNTAVGLNALRVSTIGVSNTALGFATLLANTEGSYNTAIGRDNLYANTTGDYNTAVGNASLYTNTEGDFNAAVGYQALFSNTTGDYNTAVGRSALYGVTTGAGNIGIGGTNSSGTYDPVFNAITHTNRLVMGSKAVVAAYVKVAWTITSDARDKTNFAPVPYGLDFVNQLNPTAYEFKLDRDAEETDGCVRYGFKAQDILALEGDNPVIIDDEDPDHLKYRGEHLVPVLVNAVQELTTMVNDLQAEVQALKEAAS